MAIIDKPPLDNTLIRISIVLERCIKLRHEMRAENKRLELLTDELSKMLEVINVDKRTSQTS